MAVSKKVRDFIQQRDNYTCQVCGLNIEEHGVKLQVDHKTAKVNGGSDDISNLVTLCAECNLTKHWRNLDTFIRERESALPLHKIRLERHIPRKTLAEKAGVCVQTLIRLEEGVSVNYINLIKVCGALDLNWKEFIMVHNHQPDRETSVNRLSAH